MLSRMPIFCRRVRPQAGTPTRMRITLARLVIVVAVVASLSGSTAAAQSLNNNNFCTSITVSTTVPTAGIWSGGGDATILAVPPVAPISIGDGAVEYVWHVPFSVALSQPGCQWWWAPFPDDASTDDELSPEYGSTSFTGVIEAAYSSDRSLFFSSDGVSFCSASKCVNYIVPILGLGSACSSSISPTQIDAPLQGVTGTVTVATADSVCDWSVGTPSKSWLTMGPPNLGLGTGTVTYTVAPHAAGVATVSIAGHTFAVRGSSQATTRYVATAQAGGLDTTQSGGPNDCSLSTAPCLHISHALSVAASGDTIDVVRGTYNEHSLPVTQAISPITISGAGAGATIVDGGAADSVFSVSAGANATFQNLTIRNGHANAGGGIRNDGSVTLTATILTGNVADTYGGAVVNAASATLTVQNGSILKGNSVTGNGGAIHSQGTVTVTDSTIAGNTANSTSGSAFGGGINMAGGSLTITRSTVSGNHVDAPASANHGGGGIALGGGTTMGLDTSTISGNSTTGHGGGISAGSSTTTITSSTISSNSAGSGSFGTAISFGQTNVVGTMTLTNSTLSGNKGGSAVIWTNGTVSMNYSTIAFNDGSVQNSGGTVDLQGTIVDTSTGGADCSGKVTDQGYNLSSDMTCLFTQKTSISGQDPRLSPLALNKPGSTDTQALQAGSPAVDAGATTVGSGGCPATDQRGVIRPDAKGTPCDLGAYESSLKPFRIVFMRQTITRLRSPTQHNRSTY